MATLQTSDTSLSSKSPFEGRRHWQHISLLSALMLLSLAIYIILFKVAPQPDEPVLPFTSVWLICFLPYLGICAFVLRTKPLVGRSLWVEVGIIFIGAFIFRALLFTCFATIFLGYLPFIILGHGQVFGFFLTYINEQRGNSGSLEALTRVIGTLSGLNLTSIVTLEHIVDVVVVGVVSLWVLILRWRKRISIVAATLVMIGLAFAISSHIFPWYTTVLLPWVAILTCPLWKDKSLSGKGLAIAMAWYITGPITLSYIDGVQASYIRPTWFLDNALLFLVGTFGVGALANWVVMAGLALAAITGTVKMLKLGRVHPDNVQ